jgi:hypothetical protein
MSRAGVRTRAAGVILLRAVEPGGFQALLTRRPGGGPCGFPAAVIDRPDYADTILQHCRSITAKQARALVGAEFSPDQALGLWIAATRALFEQSGVLLAGAQNAAEASISDRRRTELRSALLDGVSTFAGIIAQEQLVLHAAALALFSHWNTAVGEKPEGETYYFAARLPGDQEPVVLSDDPVEHLWLTPDAALLESAHGRLPLQFAAFASLRTLADFDSLESVMKAFAPNLSRE